MWPLHPSGNQKICSRGPQKRPQDGRITLLKPPFWHAKHAQNAHAKIEPDSIGAEPTWGVSIAFPPPESGGSWDTAWL
jgi:hypothetical protein